MSSNTAACYKLGKITFSVDGCDSGFQAQLDMLLPVVSCPESVKPYVFKNHNNDVRFLLNQVLKEHDRCLWIDAAALINPNGLKILIAGLSGAGKSTTAMALAFGSHWKTLGEDIVLIDLEKHKILSFSSPFSLKPGTYELLEKTVGNGPKQLINGEWASTQEHACAEEPEAKFDYAFLLRNARSQSKFQVKDVSDVEFIRYLLPISNLIKADAVQAFQGMLPSKCSEIIGGSLVERLEFIKGITAHGPGITQPRA